MRFALRLGTLGLLFVMGCGEPAATIPENPAPLPAGNAEQPSPATPPQSIPKDG